jgi:hypothetical protein
MKFLSLMTMTALLSITACSHHGKKACGDKTSCSKEEGKKACCQKEKCDKGSCKKEQKK